MRLFALSALLFTSVLPAAGCIDFYKDIIEDALLPPETECGVSPADVEPEAEEFTVRLANGSKIFGWWIPAKTTDTEGTVLFSTGNLGTASCAVSELAWLPDAGYNLVIYDYPGRGFSDEAVKSLCDFVPAGQAVADWIFSNKNNTDIPLFLLGVSLGTPVSATLAKNNGDDFRAVVLDSSFEVEEAGDVLAEDIDLGLLEIFRPLIRGGVLAAFPADLNLRIRIPAVRQPLLMLHGGQDHLTSVETARALFDQAGMPDKFVEFPDRGHDEASYYESEIYRAEILTFLEGIE